MDLSVTPVAQFGTLATHGAPLDGRRQGQDGSGKPAQPPQQAQVQQVQARQASGVVVPPQAGGHTGQFRPVENGQGSRKAGNDSRQYQPDVAQSAAQVQEQAAVTATHAAATRQAMQYGGMQSGRATAIAQTVPSRPTPQAVSHATDTYAFMARQGVMTKALAPWGTGISLQV